MAEKQKTISKPITLSGFGLHTGGKVNLTFNPAPENFGYKFKRTDLEENPLVEADVDYVVNTSRSTTIEKNGIKIATIEHVLSACYGLEIDNILIELDNSEVPILDGSSQLFTEALKKAEIVEQNAEKKYFEIKENINYIDKENGIELYAYPDDKYEINVLISYNSDVLFNQYAILNDISEYDKEIAGCKTFVFLHELEYLLQNNLIKGGDLSNAIVIIDKEVTQQELNRLADLFNKPHIEVKPQGMLNNIELIFANEPARHKLLDLVGDLALIGCPIKGKIIAKKPGHKANVEFAKKIKNIIKKEKSKKLVPHYDPTKPPLLNINQIQNILPHRPPFLLVDKILDLKDNYVVGLKNVTMNEGFFVGHFPNQPIMPGVLQVEAMAQVGGILVLNIVPDPENYLTYFLKIDKVKFRKSVVPGDTVLFRLDLISPIRRGIANMFGRAYVGNNIVMEAELTAQIIKKEKK
ncbi:MAG: bifunctional UDP-3-O-[3-hydroxymyristoyl] N-acetylglucosamine deacetylase/3-hydroxyacyl-ACP dehydratase [Bacteroidales bacterium]|nr:bifunctional UDP-3-O-[3-hydroxymyristoyl] N-acetylglucosamine deacetylase/3-hydroxyacyl-ACP dehydratase [Bacteroidales bacterium]